MKIKRIIFIFFLASTLQAFAQDGTANVNLRNYYTRKLNFGFLIAFNRANFYVDPITEFGSFDSLKTMQPVSFPGFNLGIVTDFALHQYFTLRFIPNIAFCERAILYDIHGNKNITYTKTIESTFLNFPVNIKMRSKRVGNFGAFVIAGGAYNLDLASKKNLSSDISPVLSQQLVKLKRDDYSYEVGAGTEFYLQYFKFAIEAKMSVGTRNLLIKENTIFANAINKLNSRMFFLSITFEG